MDEVNYLHMNQQHMLREMEEQTRLLTLLARKAGIDTETTDTDGRYPLPEGKKYHFFISHSQATGGDQANLLCTNVSEDVSVRILGRRKLGCAIHPLSEMPG